VLGVSSRGSNDAANIESVLLNPCQCLGEIVVLLVGLEMNIAPLSSIPLQNFRLDAVHVAEDGLRKDTPVEAFTQGAVAGKHHIGLLDQRQDDLIANPFSGGKHNTRLTCHKSG